MPLCRSLTSLLAGGALFISSPLLAAERAPAPGSFLRDLALTRNYTLGRPTQALPTPDGKSVLFLRTAPREPVNALYRFDVASGQTSVLVTPEEVLKGGEELLSAEERAQRERRRISTRGFAGYKLSSDGRFVLVSLSGRLYTVRLADRVVQALATGDKPALNVSLSPDGKKLAYVRDRDLYVLDLASRRERRLTHAAKPTITNGLPEFVAEEEMDRHEGYWWAPDSGAIAFEEADTAGVERFGIGDAAHPEAPVEPVAYPRPGKANATVRLGVVGLTGGAPRWVRWERERLPYLTKVVWSEHAPLTLVVESRDQKSAELLVADAAGATRRLVEEHDAAWVHVDSTLPAWLPDGTGFLWWSFVAGVPTLRLHRPDGTVVRALSRPEESYRGLLAIEPDGKFAWYSGNPTPIESQLYRVPVAGGVPLPVTEGRGQHRGKLSDRQSEIWVESRVTEAELARTFVHRRDAGGDHVVGELPSVALQPPFMSKQELVQVGALKFWASIVRPRDFDPKRSYPVIVDVYGGPHHQQVTASPALMRQWMADRGAVVVAIDGRGTPGRGHDWERHIRDDFTRTVDDQATGLQALGKRYPELDLRRVGIIGWSFGGYAAALAVLKRGEVFHAAVAGAPVVDWADYDTFYTERYLGVPPAAAPAYQVSSLLSYVERLERPLLVVHGTSDDNVYFFQSLKLVKALFRAGRQFQFLPLVGLTHMVPDPVVTEELHARTVGFLLDHLPK